MYFGVNLSISQILSNQISALFQQSFFLCSCKHRVALVCWTFTNLTLYTPCDILTNNYKTNKRTNDDQK